jgi:hypothetical protein
MNGVTRRMVPDRPGSGDFRCCRAQSAVGTVSEFLRADMGRDTGHVSDNTDTLDSWITRARSRR